MPNYLWFVSKILSLRSYNYNESCSNKDIFSLTAHCALKNKVPDLKTAS